MMTSVGIVSFREVLGAIWRCCKTLIISRESDRLVARHDATFGISDEGTAGTMQRAA